MERLNEDIETVKQFCYFRNTFNASGAFEMTIVARTRIRWMRFLGGEVLNERFLLMIKGRVYQSSNLCMINNTIWKQNIAFERKRNGIIKKN